LERKGTSGGEDKLGNTTKVPYELISQCHNEPHYFVQLIYSNIIQTLFRQETVLAVEIKMMQHDGFLFFR
jgi:hypothetical protein